MASPSTTSIIDHELADDTHNLYDITFFDHMIYTVVTNTPSFVDIWISDTERLHRYRLNSLIVGLDVEWRPNRSRNVDNPIATIQICVGSRCLIFHVIHAPAIPQSLKEFLNNPAYTFAGVGIESDVEKLTEDYDLVVAKTVDVRRLAAEKYGERKLKNAGLKALASRVLGKEINKPKTITMSQWDNPWLLPAQVLYASIDAFLSFEIARTLISENQNPISQGTGTDLLERSRRVDQDSMGRHWCTFCNRVGHTQERCYHRLGITPPGKGRGHRHGPTAQVRIY